MRIGIDLGGTKIEGALLNASGEIVTRQRVATPREDYGKTVEAIVGFVRSLRDHAGGQATVGVAIPGTICPFTHLVKNANSTWLIGKPLDRDLEAALGQSVRLANDANCFALSEAVDGAAAGADPVFGVILGTGVGGGVVAGGRLIQGAHGIGGEWGHNPLPSPRDDERPGPLCYCGRHGCIETFLSGPAFEREFAALTGRSLSATDIATTAVDAGDAVAQKLLQRYAERLARALGSIINVVDPQVIVLGGGLSKIKALYGLVPEILPNFVFSPTLHTKLVAPKHGDSSGVRGAAWLWPQ